MTDTTVRGATTSRVRAAALPVLVATAVAVAVSGCGAGHREINKPDPGVRVDHAKALENADASVSENLTAFYDRHHAYPVTARLAGGMLDLVAADGTEAVADDDRLTSAVTLGWYRPFADSREGRVGTSPGQPGSYSYCLSTKKSHKIVTGNPTGSNLSVKDGSRCPAAPTKP